MFIQTTDTAFVDSVLKLNEFGSEPSIFYSRDLDGSSTPLRLLKWREKEEERVKIQTCTFFFCSVLGVFVCFLSAHILYDWAMFVRVRQTRSRSTRQDQQIHYVCLINNFLWKIDVFWLKQLFTLTIVIPLT